jgi:hypothetical protein
MDRRPFDAPVTVFLGNSRQFRVVANVTEASDFLFDYWSENDSAPWLSAMNKCSAAMMGRLGPEQVRSAFIEAVRGAGMQINCEISLP